jgi:hypothetical protein
VPPQGAASGRRNAPIGVLCFELTARKMSRPLAAGQENEVRRVHETFECEQACLFAIGQSWRLQMSPSPVVAEPPGQPVVADRRLALLTCVSSDPTASPRSDRE